MIDKEKVLKCIDAMNALCELGVGLRPYLELLVVDDWSFWCFGPDEGIPDDARQKALAILTPLVGKMQLHDRNWTGEGNGISIYFPHANLCKVIGYKKVKKMVKRKIEREPEYEEVEEEQNVPITDCDVKAGRASESDIEVPI